MTLAERLDKAIKNKGITPYRVEQDINISRVLIGKYLKGTEPSVNNIFLLANYLGVSLDWLITGEGEMLNSRPSNLSNSFVGDGNKNIQVGHGSKTIRTNESDKDVVSALEKKILILEGELKSKDKEIEGLKNSLTDKERLVQVLMNNLTDKSL